MTLPTGAAVSFLFTDIDGSTRLERAVGSDVWAALVGRHDEILRAAMGQGADEIAHQFVTDGIGSHGALS